MGAVVWSGWTGLVLLTLPPAFHGMVLGADVAWPERPTETFLLL